MLVSNPTTMEGHSIYYTPPLQFTKGYKIFLTFRKILSFPKHSQKNISMNRYPLRKIAIWVKKPIILKVPVLPVVPVVPVVPVNPAILDFQVIPVVLILLAVHVVAVTLFKLGLC